MRCAKRAFIFSEKIPGKVRFEGIRIDAESFKKHLKPETAQLYLAAFRQAAKDMAPLLPAAQKDVDLWVRLAKTPITKDGKTLPYTVQCELKAQESPENAASQALQERLNSTPLPGHALSDPPYQVLSVALAQLGKVLIATVGEAFASRLVTLEAENETLQTELVGARKESSGETSASKGGIRKGSIDDLLQQDLESMGKLNKTFESLLTRYEDLDEEIRTLETDRDKGIWVSEVDSEEAEALYRKAEKLNQALVELSDNFSDRSILFKDNLDKAPGYFNAAMLNRLKLRDALRKSMAALDERLDALSFDLMERMDVLNFMRAYDAE